MVRPTIVEVGEEVLRWDRIYLKSHTKFETVVAGLKVTIDRDTDNRYSTSWYWKVTKKDGSEVSIGPYPSSAFGLKFPSTYQGPYSQITDVFVDVNSWAKPFEEIEEPL